MKRVRSALVCPYCRDTVARGAASVVCARPRCAALYHRECWQQCSEEHGHCAVYGCPSVVANETSVWRHFVAIVRRWRVEKPEPRLVLAKSEIARRVIETLSSSAEVPITRRTPLGRHLRDVLIDSLDTVELVMELEEALEHPLDELDLAEFDTVGDLIDHLDERFGEG